jgi:predicted  nucleic acid-binding Zn-ribbon protein
MINLRHECTACSSQFTVSYNELYTESDPTHCPFCGEYLILDDDDFDDEIDDESL